MISFHFWIITRESWQVVVVVVVVVVCCIHNKDNDELGNNAGVSDTNINDEGRDKKCGLTRIELAYVIWRDPTLHLCVDTRLSPVCCRIAAGEQ